MKEYPGFVTIQEYLKLPRNQATWILKDLLPISGAALMYSPPKVGKTAAMIQLACALSGGADEWLGFPIVSHGKVLFLELDTPRSTFALRFQDLAKHGVRYNQNNILIADRESLQMFPFDIAQSQPEDHMIYLRDLVRQHDPMVVIIDTLRKVHSLDEDSSTDMSNVVSRLIGACHPAAMILVSHSRKPNMEGHFDLMMDHRGSGSVVGEMDAVMKLTKTRLYYGGRNIEEGDIKIERMNKDTDGLLLWRQSDDAVSKATTQVLNDPQLPSMRQKAKALSTMVGKTEDACMSILRRKTAHLKRDGDTIDPNTGEVVSEEVVSPIQEIVIRDTATRPVESTS